MISIDAVRAAVLSDAPWTRLDELVRAELDSGRTTKQIFDELRGLAKEVRGTPGLSEDGEDAFGDTLDALVGFCSPEYAYKNPPILPSEEEITELPRWARVTFAERCARRQPPGMEGARPAKWVGQVGGKDVFSFPSGDIETAVATINAVAKLLPEPARAYIRRDFDHLARLAQWQHWTDDTPVPPEVFGPLWPEGPPPGWPANPDLPPRAELPLAFLVREGTSPRFVEDEVVNLFNALNRYYILRTGNRLTVDGDIHTLLAALHPAGVT